MNSPINALAEQVLKRAASCGLSVVTAESCTAGALAQALAAAEGASKHFHGGIVAYTKPMKSKALDVAPSLLAEKSAVSAEAAIAMAEGALAHSPADLAVSITGVAGPKPDEDGNPVGLVYCAVVRHGAPARHIRFVSGGENPENVIEDAMRRALLLLEEACERASATSDV